MTRHVRRATRLLLLYAAIALPGTVEAASGVNERALDLLARQFDAARAARQDYLYRQLVVRSDGPQGRLNRDERIQLMFVDERGMPRFYIVNNLNAARTLGTDLVWPGGASGHLLDGSGTLLGELSEWDGGGVRTSHNEFQGRVVQMDTVSGTFSSHATHVAGTMVAFGTNASARGMSYAGSLAAYDWNSDNSEMATAAANGMLVSNHSYGFATGWLRNWDGSGEWFWFGDTTLSATEDYGFGFYGTASQEWDQIAFNAPNYLICKSAGNDRNDFGPAQPDSHYVWDEGLDDWVWSMTVRDPDGGPDGYDSVSWMGTAKNILTVGSVTDITSGWSSPLDVNLNLFSGWGPTDDGRIKPDIVANGNSLFSATATSNTDYAFSSGTSMSSPNAAGSINLLVQQYKANHAGTPARSATIKAVLFHTADEAGAADGPDYEHGWGLLNVDGAADLIAADTANMVREETLVSTTSESYTLQHPGGDLRVTLAWTDPPGTPPAPAVDPPTSMLVNDLDLRVEEVATATVHEPWILDPASPVSPATTGDNFRDNHEQVYVPNAPAGTYNVTVSHKDVLADGAQEFSLVADDELADGSTVSVPLPRPALRMSSYPNPFSQSTTIRFELPIRSRIEMGVFDLSGRRVRDLENAERDPGRYVIVWDGRTDRGARLPAGVYFLRASAAGESQVERLVLIE